MERFRWLADGEPEESARFLETEPPGDLIGVYLNHPPTVSEAIVVSESGLLLETEGRWRQLSFSSVDRVATPTTKVLVRHLDLALKDGSVVRLPIEGGDEKVADAFEFLRFLDRVLADQDSMGITTVPAPQGDTR
jgi:hypothetical protein